MDLTIVTGLIRDLGFPIFVAAFLLLRFDKQLAALLNSQTKVVALLERIANSATK